jgi:hypothetical protein
MRYLLDEVSKYEHSFHDMLMPSRSYEHHVTFMGNVAPSLSLCSENSQCLTPPQLTSINFNESLCEALVKMSPEKIQPQIHQLFSRHHGRDAIASIEDITSHTPCPSFHVPKHQPHRQEKECSDISTKLVNSAFPLFCYSPLSPQIFPIIHNTFQVPKTMKSIHLHYTYRILTPWMTAYNTGTPGMRARASCWHSRNGLLNSSPQHIVVRPPSGVKYRRWSTNSIPHATLIFSCLKQNTWGSHAVTRSSWKPLMSKGVRGVSLCDVHASDVESDCD